MCWLADGKRMNVFSEPSAQLPHHPLVYDCCSLQVLTTHQLDDGSIATDSDRQVFREHPRWSPSGAGPLMACGGELHQAKQRRIENSMDGNSVVLDFQGPHLDHAYNINSVAWCSDSQEICSSDAWSAAVL